MTGAQFGSFILGLIVVAIVVWLSLDPNPPAPPDFLAWDKAQHALAYGTLLAFVLNTILWFTAISRVGAPHATLWANMQPFLGAVFAVLAQPWQPIAATGSTGWGLSSQRPGSQGPPLVIRFLRLTL